MGFKFNALTGKFDLVNDGGTGSSTFIGLSDVDPTEYTGQAGKIVKVNSTADGLEFGAVTPTYVVTEINDDYSILTTDTHILVDTSVKAIVVELPTAQMVNGRRITIKDMGNASVNPIAIHGENSEDIDFEPVYAIASNGHSITLFSDGTQWWVE